MITIDPMGTQKAIAAQIHQGNADYILTLLANHPTLYGQVKGWFEQAQARNFADIEVSIDERVETGHHRIEKRQLKSTPVTQLPPLHSLCRLGRPAECGNGGTGASVVEQDYPDGPVLPH